MKLSLLFMVIVTVTALEYSCSGCQSYIAEVSTKLAKALEVYKASASEACASNKGWSTQCTELVKRVTDFAEASTGFVFPPQPTDEQIKVICSIILQRCPQRNLMGIPINGVSCVNCEYLLSGSMKIAASTQRNILDMIRHVACEHNKMNEKNKAKCSLWYGVYIWAAVESIEILAKTTVVRDTCSQMLECQR